MLGETSPITIGLVVGLGGALAALWFRIEGMFAAEQEARIAIERDLAAYKLAAVDKFATAGAIEKSEERLAIALDKVTARLETVIGRIEALSIAFARSTGQPQ
jgi:hypothetical protein